MKPLIATVSIGLALAFVTEVGPIARYCQCLPIWTMTNPFWFFLGMLAGAILMLLLDALDKRDK